MKHNHLFLFTLFSITFIFMAVLFLKSRVIEGLRGGGLRGGIGRWGGIGRGRGYGYGYLGSGYYGNNPSYIYGVEQYPYPYLYYNSYY
jgi:hypothetical protein